MGGGEVGEGSGSERLGRRGEAELREVSLGLRETWVTCRAEQARVGVRKGKVQVGAVGIAAWGWGLCVLAA